MNKKNLKRENKNQHAEHIECLSLTVCSGVGILWIVLLFFVSKREKKMELFSEHIRLVHTSFSFFFSFQHSAQILNDNCLLTVDSNTNTYANVNTFLKFHEYTHTHTYTITHSHAHNINIQKHRNFHWQFIVGTLNFPNRKCAENLIHAQFSNPFENSLLFIGMWKIEQITFCLNWKIHFFRYLLNAHFF